MTNSKSARQNADQSKRLAVQANGCAEQIALRAELALEQAIAHHRHARGAGLDLLRRKNRGPTPAERREWKRNSALRGASVSWTMSSPEPILKGCGMIPASCSKEPGLLDPFPIGFAGHARHLTRRSLLPNHNQAVGIAIRKRPQDYGVKDAEDRRICADAKRERKNRGEAKDRLFSKCPKGKCDIHSENAIAFREWTVHQFIGYSVHRFRTTVTKWITEQPNNRSNRFILLPLLRRSWRPWRRR